MLQALKFLNFEKVDFDPAKLDHHVEGPKKPREPKFYGPSTLEGPKGLQRAPNIFSVSIMVIELFKVQKPHKQGKWLADQFWRACLAVQEHVVWSCRYPFDRGSKTVHPNF